MTTCMGDGVHMAVADDVFGGVLFVLSFFPTRCLG